MRREADLDLELRDKVVLVTGAAQGIGRAIAKTFASEGAQVALVDLAHPSATVSEIKEAGGLALPIIADVTNAAQVNDAVDTTLRTFGRIDVLVNNAGVLREAYLLETDEALWDHMLAVNLKSVYLFCKAVGPVMLAQRSGCIINAASFAALVPSAGHGAYAAAKAGVISLTKTLAGELGPYGVRVFAYVPGVIATALTEAMREKASSQLLSSIPMGKFGEAQDVANVVVLLASKPASYVNGAVIEVSGGKLAIQNVAAAQQRAGLML